MFTSNSTSKTVAVCHGKPYSLARKEGRLGAMASCILNYYILSCTKSWDRSRVAVNLIHEDDYEFSAYDCLIKVDIFHTDLEDSGKYYIDCMKENCTKPVAKITVNETPPTCLTLFKKDGNRLSATCKWMPRNHQERVQIKKEDQILYEYNNNIMTANYENTTTENSIRRMIKIEDAFSRNKMPNVCSISNNFSTQICNFAITVLPEINEGELVGHTAIPLPSQPCPSNGNRFRLWWYNKHVNSSSPITIGQYVEVDLNNY